MQPQMVLFTQAPVSLVLVDLRTQLGSKALHNSLCRMIVIHRFVCSALQPMQPVMGLLLVGSAPVCCLLPQHLSALYAYNTQDPSVCNAESSRHPGTS